MIEEGRCKGCGLCVIFCPEDVLAMAEDRFNVKGYRPVVCTEPAGCTGCGVCAAVCGDDAIRMEEQDEQRLSTLRSLWREWERLPDTSGATIAR
ncbi:MAG: 4Fe-4S dicluster domain-containing protein, partial [Actinomycetia bacterium]|nr:4Fe-4S dicluster domain-containing protein [Actinomycetes bacterium]